MEKILTYTIVFIITLFIVAVLSGIPVYFLWNWLVPSIFGLRAITFLEGIGLSLLASCFFSSKSSSGSSKS